MPAVAYPAPNGTTILMVGGDATFQTRVNRSLGKIRQTLAGTALLNGIQANRVTGKFVTIHPGAGSSCACLSHDSSVSRTRLAQAIFDDPANFPAELAACMAAAPAPANTAAGLAALINATPVYAIQGLPNAAPSNLGVTAAHISNWIAGTAVFPAPFAAPQRSALERALLVALWPQARQRPGTGGHSRVNWNSGSGSIGLTTGVREVRSKTIGLAHELVHAYYNGCGLQMGRDNPLANAAGVPTVQDAALFEYMCVGLGIWAAEPISENAIRGQWHTVVSYTLFGGRANINYGLTAARPCY